MEHSRCICNDQRIWPSCATVLLMVTSDESITMAAEVGRGIRKPDSQYANMTSEHGTRWDQLVTEAAKIKSAGWVLDPSKEIADPGGYDMASGSYTVG